MISGIIKPLIPSTVKGVPSLRQFADAARKVSPAIAIALERTQQALDVHDRALRSQPQQADEFIFTDANGEMIAWLGARDGYWGGWFGQIYVGATGPVDAPFFVDTNGVVSIGKNGYVQLLDPGGNPVGWLGTAVDAAKFITAATNTDPVVITITAHGYENGDTVFIDGATGNTAINGYRIVKTATVNTFEITDLAGVNVAGNGAYAGAATAIRYFGGGLFETLAIGTSFPDYKLRAFADGSLKIKDALITLTDGDKIITLDPTGPMFKFQDGDSELTITGTGGGTHRIDFSIEDASDPDLFTVAFNSQGEFQLNGYTHQASVDVMNYGRPSQIYLGASGGTVAAPSGIAGVIGRIDMNAYDGGTLIGQSSVAGFMDAGAAKLQALIDDVVIAEFHALGLDINVGTLYLMDSGITPGLPLKLDSSRGLTTGKIDLGSSSDIAFSGAGAYEYIRWDGAALQTVNIAVLAAELATYFSSSTHTHDVTGTAEEAGTPAHTHAVSGSTGAPV